MDRRILMTGSRDFSGINASHAALGAALALLGSTASEVTLVHGAAAGADRVVSAMAGGLGMNLEPHPARWSEHTDACPTWHAGQGTCKMAGHRRNAEMIQAGADLVLAFPMHPQRLRPGQDRKGTSRGTWHCAENAADAGLPVLVVWEGYLFPLGEAAASVLRGAAERLGLELGLRGQLLAKDLLPVPVC